MKLPFKTQHQHYAHSASASRYKRQTSSGNTFWLTVPRQHGAWIALLSCFLLGVAMAGEVSVAVLILLVSSISGYLLRHTLVTYIQLSQKNRCPRHLLSFAAIYALGFAGGGIILLAVYKLWFLLWIGCLAIVIACFTMYFKQLRMGHSISAGLVGFLGLTLLAPAAEYTASTTLTSQTFIVWLLSAAFFTSSVFRVHYLIHHRTGSKISFRLIGIREAVYTLIFVCLSCSVFQSGILVAMDETSSESSIAAEEQADKSVSKAEEKETDDFWDRFSGYLKLQFRGRFSGDENDSDLYQYFLLNYGNLNKDKFSFTVYERSFTDLDDDLDNYGFSSFDSIADTYNKPFRADLLYGYANFRDIGPISLVRTGRQHIYETPRGVYFDGARIDFKPIKDVWDLELSAYAGIPVHLQEANRSDDFLFGFNATIQPLEKTRIRADFLSIKEDYQFSNTNEPANLHESLHSYSLWQGFGENLDLYANLSMRDSELDNGMLRATYYSSEWDLLLQASIYRLFETQTDQVLVTDPFYQGLRDYFEYTQTDFLISKGFGNHFTIDAGYDGRDLRDEADEGAYNHEFRHFYASPGYSDIFGVNGLDASATFDYWSSRDDIQSYGVDFSYRPDKKWKIDAGTNFSLYQYDYYLGRERTDVQSFYCKVRCKWNDYIECGVSLDHDNDDEESFTQFKLSVTFKF